MCCLNLGSVLKILLDFLHFIKYFELKSHKREWDSTKNNYSNKLSRKKRMSEGKVVNTLLLHFSYKKHYLLQYMYYAAHALSCLESIKVLGFDISGSWYFGRWHSRSWYSETNSPSWEIYFHIQMSIFWSEGISSYMVGICIACRVLPTHSLSGILIHSFYVFEHSNDQH